MNFVWRVYKRVALLIAVNVRVAVYISHGNYRLMFGIYLCLRCDN